MWTPSSLEDRLLKKHFEENPGMAYLELPLSITSEPGRARRVDAVLMPGDTTQVHRQGGYSTQEAIEAIQGHSVHVIEAKRGLNRGVIGQVMVARHLIENLVNPTDIAMDVVCAKGSADLEDFCEQEGIAVHIYPILRPRHASGPGDTGRVDVRRTPDEARRSAFLSGWTQAVNGHLFGSIRKRKTHANMGNLFGWIYGDTPQEFRMETWRRYVDHAVGLQDEEDGLNRD